MKFNASREIDRLQRLEKKRIKKLAKSKVPPIENEEGIKGIHIYSQCTNTGNMQTELVFDKTVTLDDLRNKQKTFAFLCGRHLEIHINILSLIDGKVELLYNEEVRLLTKRNPKIVFVDQEVGYDMDGLVYVELVY